MKDGYYAYGRSTVSGFESDPVHVHPHHEIFLLTEGEIEYMIDGVLFRMIRGDIAVVGRGVPHAKRCCKGDGRIVVLVIEDDFFLREGCEEYAAFLRKGSTTEHLVGAEYSRESGLLAAFSRLGDYSDGFSEIYRPVVRGVITEILYLITRGRYSEEYREDPRISRIIEYVDLHITEKITLDQIAEAVYLSKYHIARMWRRLMGMTVMEYVTRKRLARAIELIQGGGGVTESALAAGFADYSAFYNAVRKEKGCSPKEYMLSIKH